MRITTPRAARAARVGAAYAATNPDPAKAVKAAQNALGDHADRYRISVSRPGVIGRPARVTVTRQIGRVTIAATRTEEVRR